MRFYENLQKTSENRERPRSYYIPEGISKCTSLNGEWKFAFFENSDIATVPTKWDRITVPSCWQLKGYEAPNYTNINFPFPCDPPYVPNVNPMGMYRREFEITDTSMEYYIVFEGVSSCAELYINGKYVGFTQGSHLMSEFDITPYIKKGSNEITVNVYKWCVGSYIEDQDMFRFNGIFRDVYVLMRPDDHIRDFKVITEGNDTVIVRTDRWADIRLFDGELLIGEAHSRYCEFKVPTPKLWTAERPYLYTLEMEYKGEIIRRRIGIREIAISHKNEITVNGRPIVIKGVNHHDTHPENGFCMTDAEILDDIRKIKEINANAIRTSHYPPSPKFLDYCDELGLYVILEADNEAHGFIYRNPTDKYDYDMTEGEWPATDPKWEKEHLSRAERTYERDKNHPSVIMWSVGNECGYGPNIEAMAEFFKLNDRSRLVHSESASYLGIDSENVDVYSRMYPSIEELEEWAESEKFSKPIFLCEYCLSQGNGAGDIWEYVELFHKYPQLVGGCIWQWADQTVLENGKATYGGDHNGEMVHSKDFCCNGIVFNDRSYKAASYELKAAYLPIRMRYEDGEIIVKNLYDFTSLADHGIRYRIRVDDVIIEEETLKLSIAPGRSGRIKPKKKPTLCSYGSSVEVALISPEGKEMGSLYQRLEAERIKAEICKDPVADKDIINSDNYITVSGKGFEYRFSKTYGNFDSIRIKGKEILNAPVRIGVYRALMNNDNIIRDRYTTATESRGENLNYTFNNVRKVSLKENCIITEGVLAGVGRRPLLSYTLKYKFFKDGRVKTDITADIHKDAPWLLRFGFEYELIKDIKSFEYFGLGPHENLPDICHHVREGMFKSNVKNEYVDYVVPQDHGNHMDVKYAEIGKLIRFDGRDSFVLNVSQYSISQLDKAQHGKDLSAPFAAHVRVDYKVSGTGSSTCGPMVRDCFRIGEKFIRFSFDMTPVK